MNPNVASPGDALPAWSWGYFFGRVVVFLMLVIVLGVGLAFWGALFNFENVDESGFCKESDAAFTPSTVKCSEAAEWVIGAGPMVILLVSAIVGAIKRSIAPLRVGLWCLSFPIFVACATYIDGTSTPASFAISAIPFIASAAYLLWRSTRRRRWT